MFVASREKRASCRFCRRPAKASRRRAAIGDTLTPNSQNHIWRQRAVHDLRDPVTTVARLTKTAGQRRKLDFLRPRHGMANERLNPVQPARRRAARLGRASAINRKLATLAYR